MKTTDTRKATKATKASNVTDANGKPSDVRASDPFPLVGRRAVDALGGIKGLRMKSSHQGLLRVGGREARLDVEPDDWVRCTSELPATETSATIDRHDALRVNHWLPGNLRFALGRRLMLVGDTRIDGERHLARSIGAIRRGMAQAAGPARGGRSSRPGSRAKQDPRGLDAASALREALREAVERIDTRRIAVVSGRDDDEGNPVWELRPRVRGESVPVRVEPCSTGGARLYRTLRLAAGDEASTTTIISDQCLRWNRRLRMCRLALVDEAVTFESRLHSEQLTEGWLSVTATSLAVAERTVAPLLRLLAREPGLEKHYVRLFVRS